MFVNSLSFISSVPIRGQKTHRRELLTRTRSDSPPHRESAASIGPVAVTDKKGIVIDRNRKGVTRGGNHARPGAAQVIADAD